MNEKKEVFRAPSTFEVKAGDDGDFLIFEGLASTFGNVDLGGDVVQAGAFMDGLARLKQRAKRHGWKQIVPMFWGHDAMHVLGSFTAMDETNEGLEVRGRMNMKSRFAREEIAPLLRDGDINGMSIGYFVDQKRFEGEIRHLEKVSVVEVSLVPIGMNPEALVTSRKDVDLKRRQLSMDDIYGEIDVRELERMLKEGISMSGNAAKTLARLAVGLRDEGGSDVGPRDVDGAKASLSLLEQLRLLNASFK